MKSIIFFYFFFIPGLAYSQTPEEQRFLDSLKLGGTYLIGKEMPGFQIESLTKTLYSSKNLQNKITFLNFWFEACVPCIAEMTALQSLYEKFKNYKKFQFLSFTYEKKEVIERIKKKFKLTYPILTTSIDSCTYLNFGKGFPTNIITNKKAKIAYFTFGGEANPDKADLNFKTNLYPLINCLLNCY
jgi:thiol-disulfide isomerase/thioredoxin